MSVPYTRYVVAVARHLAKSLHPTTATGRCRCGACRHLIVGTANRTGISVERLVAALPAEARPAPTPPHPRAPLTGRVAENATTTISGRRHDGVAAAPVRLGAR